MTDQLFVAPIPKEFPTDELKAMFQAIGEIHQFHRPQKGEAPAGYAFVTMATPELNQAAIEKLHGYSFGEEHKPLQVSIAENRPRKKQATETGKGKFAEQDLVAAEIADQLNETEHQPRNTIRRIVQTMGIEQAREWVRQTLEIEANGGMMMEKLGRRRTAGGVFFYVVKQAMPSNKLQFAFPKENWRARKSKSGDQPKAPPPPPQDPAFDWENRVDALQELFNESGSTASTKVVIVGRPDSVDVSSNQVTVLIKRNFHLTTAPRGVPRPPAAEAATKVYIALKMWNKIEAALKDPEDRLVAEGFCAWEQGRSGLSVYATMVTTAEMQKQRWGKSDTDAPTE